MAAGGSPFGGGPSVVPPPIFAQGLGTTPLSPLGGAAAPSTAAGPSDFTRMISKAPAPVVPEAAPPAPATPAKATAAKKGIPAGLAAIIGVVVLIAVLILVFVLRQPVPTVPTVPSKPTVPTAPAVALPKP
jgi:hypothetical protein